MVRGERVSQKKITRMTEFTLLFERSLVRYVKFHPGMADMMWAHLNWMNEYSLQGFYSDAVLI